MGFWKKRMSLALAAILLILLADQISKELVMGWFGLHYETVRVTSFFNLVLVFNPGVSFGLFGDLGEKAPWLLLAITSVIICAISVWLWRILGLEILGPAEKLSAAALTLVIGGAIGNNIDRIRIGAVVDFLDFHLRGYHWPAFNLADAGISIGAILLIIASFLPPQKSP